MIHQKQLIYQTLLKIKNLFSVKDTAQRIKNQIQNMRKCLQNTFHKNNLFQNIDKYRDHSGHLMKLIANLFPKMAQAKKTSVTSEAVFRKFLTR